MTEKKIGNHVQQEKKAMRLPSYRKLILGLGFEIYRGIVNIGYPVTFKNQ